MDPKFERTKTLLKHVRKQSLISLVDPFLGGPPWGDGGRLCRPRPKRRLGCDGRAAVDVAPVGCTLTSDKSVEDVSDIYLGGGHFKELTQ